MQDFLKRFRQNLTASFLIKTIILLVFYFVALYVSASGIVFSDQPDAQIPLGLFIAAFVLASALFAFIVIFSLKKDGYKPNYILLAIIGVLFIAQLFTILLFKNDRAYSVTISDGSIYSFVYSMNSDDYFRYLASFIMMVMITFTTLDIIPKVYKDYVLFIYIWCLVFLLIVFASIIGSLILEFQKIAGLFSLESFEDLPSLAIKSFYPSKNAFGFVILMGIVATLFMATMDFKYCWLIVLAVLEIPLILTQCKLGVGISVVLLIGFGIIRFVFTYKGNEKRNWIILSSIAATVGLMILIVFLIPTTNKAIQGIIDNVFQEKFGKSTMDGRTKIWEYSFVELSYFNIFTGVGFKLFNAILGKFNCADVAYYVTFDTTSPHNAYIELLGNGGIILLLAWLAIFAMGIYLLAKLYKKNKLFFSFEILTLFTIISLSILEAGTIIFAQTAEYLLLTIILFIPLIGEELKEKSC